ncbi:hypothetical protein BN844_0298 [Pseudomonas sp. SHC52]|nr:hypothetical protein BN844_0298 [Pseudomonas sp. SHC52]
MPGKQGTDALLFSLADQRHCFAEGGAGWFFHQHVFAGGQGLLHQRESTLRRRAKRYCIDLGTAGEQLAQGLEILYPGTGLPLRGNRHQLERRIGVDGGYMLILGNLAVAHQTETNRLHLGLLIFLYL